MLRVHVCVCVNPSVRGVFHLVNGSLGTHCRQKGQTDTEIKTTWCWDGNGERRKEKKSISDHFLTHIYDTLFPFALFPPQRGMRAWWKCMSFHYQRIVRTDCRGPERGACAFWQVNMWNSYANRYANCVSERMLAHCELFHSKQPWPKLWIMTTSASARICKHQVADRQG